MKYKITDLAKPATSITAIFLFLFVALASLGPDASTNTTVALDPTKCEEKPLINSGFSVHLVHKDKVTKLPIPNAPGELFWTFQKVVGTECKYHVIKVDHLSFTTDAQGVFSYSSTATQMVDQLNAADLIRVEVRMDETLIYEGANAIGVAYYGPGNFSFRTFSLRKNAL